MALVITPVGCYMDVAQALEILREQFTPNDNLAMTSEGQDQIISICLDDMDDDSLLADNSGDTGCPGCPGGCPACPDKHIIDLHNSKHPENQISGYLPEEDRSGASTPASMDRPAEPSVPIVGAVWKEVFPSLLGDFADDEDSEMPRMQLYGIKGNKINDDALKVPQVWEQIAGIRRGHLSNREPFLTPTWEDYVSLKGHSIKKLVNYSYLMGDNWRSIVPACVTIYRVMKGSLRYQAGQVWATIETQGSGQNRFGCLEAILGPRMVRGKWENGKTGIRDAYRDPAIYPSDAVAATLEAKARERNQGARGGVKGPGDPKKVAPRPSKPYQHDNRHKDRRHQDKRRGSVGSERQPSPTPDAAVNADRQAMPPPSAPPAAQGPVGMPQLAYYPMQAIQPLYPNPGCPQPAPAPAPASPVTSAPQEGKSGKRREKRNYTSRH